MHGRTRAKCPISRGRRAAFSLIEILIVVTIMAAVFGVVGSLLAGYTGMFNETDDEAAAKQRAADVFNALELPVAHAALGIPTGSMEYFDLGLLGTVNRRAPIADWGAPLEILDTSGDYTPTLSGDVLRVVYSVPAGVKNGTERKTDFMDTTRSADHPGDVVPNAVSLTLADALSADLVLKNAADTRAFITGPEVYSTPLWVQNGTGTDTITVWGRKQPQAYTASPDEIATFNRGEIVPFQDIHAVRAIAAYVDDRSVFHAAEVNSTDVSVENPAESPSPAHRDAAGFRVEGVKAVWFTTDEDRRTLTVRVLAEGDIVDQTRRRDTARWDELRARWPNVTSWDERVYYEGFEMTWRVRNYAP